MNGKIALLILVTSAVVLAGWYYDGSRLLRADLRPVVIHDVAVLHPRPGPTTNLTKLSFLKGTARPTTMSQPTPEDSRQACQERTKIVFIKTHKTGGTSFIQILHRFGYLRNLSFVIPTRRNTGSMNGLYPKGLKKKSNYLPPQGGAFDILAYHTIYDRKAIADLFKKPENVAFVTLLREPLSQFRSSFNYYRLAKSFNIVSETPMASFLQNPVRYNPRLSLPSLTKSPMALDLGFPPTAVISATALSLRNHSEKYSSTIRDFARKISEEFDLVMLTEFFDESLVLFKRMMCWQLKDILYYKSNGYIYKQKEEVLNEKLRQSHKRWDVVDYPLYEKLNNTLRGKIKELGNDFLSEVDHFKMVNAKMHQYCLGNSNIGERDYLAIEKSTWNEMFVITPDFCTLAKLGIRCYMTLLRDRNLRVRNASHNTNFPTNNAYEPLTRIDNDKRYGEGFYTERYCQICEDIKRDCTLNEYLTHLFHERLIYPFDTSFYVSVHGGRGPVEKTLEE
ncbi:PREDICTED: galactosylceramide sulfotransferase-like [Branchiostoma belcheri]|uniref:Galactosylceramide sulfotransferase-like n=1 Tax=Branchiostoma belcheri TaxID=7741 RepID=A0A6P4ZHV1_BRABE|nr:PREDICTED: galactosylceramide sulfotransferase-like [Branchiostoma belcheri]